MKKNVVFLLLIMLGYCAYAQTIGEINQMKTVLFQKYKQEFSVKGDQDGRFDITYILNNIEDNGKIKGRTYANNAEYHSEIILNSMNVLAAQYHNFSGAKKNEIKEAYFKGINYWLNQNIVSGNWWYNTIQYPRLISYGYLLMHDQLESENETLFNRLSTYIKIPFDDRPEVKTEGIGSYYIGVNGADVSLTPFIYALANNNATYLSEVLQFVDFTTNKSITGNGVAHDNMFGAHSLDRKTDKGDLNGLVRRQLYLVNYGKEYMKSILTIAEATKGTSAFDYVNIENLENLFIHGVKWVVYKNNYDVNQIGRTSNKNNVGTNNHIDEFFKIGERLKQVSTKNNEIQQAIEAMNGAQPLAGNKMFWRFDYMVHRNPNFMVTYKMSSNTTMGTEKGSGYGKHNFYSGMGANYVYYYGDEYDKLLSNKNFNQRQFPGITAEQDNGTLDFGNWAQGGVSSESDFAGGATDGVYGASGMLAVKRGVTAHKALFFFKDEYVALGAGITKSGGSEIYTTINQCNLAGNVLIKTQNNSITSLSENNTNQSSNLEWVLHNNIGYFNLENDTIITSNTNDIFTLNINHGQSPSNAKYAYVIKPDLSNQDAAVSYKNTNLNDIKILSNTAALQAVKHKDLGVYQFITYENDALVELENGIKVRMHQPAAVVINTNANTIAVANIKADREDISQINVTVIKGDIETTMNFEMPKGVNAGSSVVQELATSLDLDECLPATASTQDRDYSPEKTLDKSLDPESRWSGKGKGAHITYCLDDVKKLKGLSIAFYKGNQRKSKFQVFTSLDSKEWSMALDTTESRGRSRGFEKFNFNDTQEAKYVKIVGYGNTLNNWNSYKEVRFNYDHSTNLYCDLFQKNYKLYPNPSDGTIHISDVESGLNITIQNIFGRVVYIGVTKDTKTTINLQHLPRGFYYVNISNKYTKPLLIK